MKTKEVLESAPFKKFIYFGGVVNLLTLALVLGLRSFLPPVVPLFYGNVLGEAQLANSVFLIIPPLGSILVMGINLSLAYITKDVFLKKLLVVSSLFITLLTTITVVRIILLVGFF